MSGNTKGEAGVTGVEAIERLIARSRAIPVETYRKKNGDEAEAELEVIKNKIASLQAYIILLRHEMNEVCIIIGSNQECEPTLHQDPWPKKKTALQNDLAKSVYILETALGPGVRGKAVVVDVKAAIALRESLVGTPPTGCSSGGFYCSLVDEAIGFIDDSILKGQQ